MKKLLLLTLSLALTSCSMMSKDVTFRKWIHKDYDQQLRAMTFLEKRLPSNEVLSAGDEAGIALEVDIEEGTTIKELGHLLFVNNTEYGEHYIIIINPETKKSAINAQQIKSLIENSSEVLIYVIGGGILENIYYKSENLPLCQALKQGENIHSKSITNYYVEQRAEPKKPLLIIEITSIFKQGNYEILSEDYEFLSQKSVENEESIRKVNQQDVKKQGRILYSELCGLPHPQGYNP